MTDGSGTTTYAYVPPGFLGALQVQQETPPRANDAIAYTYDALGRLASRTVTGQGAETFAYDPIGRLNSHAGDLGAFTLAWLGQSGQIASRALTSSNLATSWTYLPNSGDRRLASVGTTGLTAGQSTSFAFTTDAANEITGTTQTSEAPIASPASASSQSATYNALNQLTNLSGQEQTFDADGNLTSDGTRTYEWDAENRLVAISYVGQPTKATAFAYDGLGRRIQMTSTPAHGSAVVTDYLWCGMKLCQARNSANAVTRGYYAEGEIKVGTPSVSDFYAPDNLGSVRRVFTATTAPTYDFDSYGKALQATASVTDFGYAGMVTNTDSGLYLTTARPYDPATGRFLTRDPAGEGADPEANLYAYVGGDPVKLSDPSGRLSIGPIPIVQFSLRLICYFAQNPKTAVQVGGAASGALIGPGGGGSGSASAVVNLSPASPLNIGLVGSAQVAAGLGGGLYGGGGLGGTVGGTSSTPQTVFSGSASPYVEADVGSGALSGSLSSTGNSAGAAGGKVGPGIGVGGFTGGQVSVTVTITPNSLINAFNGTTFSH